MCFTCSSQEGENNQANHLVANSHLPTTRLDVNDLPLSAFIPQPLCVSSCLRLPSPQLHTSIQFLPPTTSESLNTLLAPSLALKNNVIFL